MSDLNKLIAAKLAQVKATAEPEQTESREEVIAARVVAALGQLGIEESRIRAALEGGEEGEAELTPMDDADPITDEEVEAGCRAVLAELGVEVEEEEAMVAEEDEALLDEISELTAKLLASAQGDSSRLYKTASRLTASLNLTLVAAGKQK